MPSQRLAERESRGRSKVGGKARALLARGAYPQIAGRPMTRDIDLTNPFSFMGFPSWHPVFNRPVEEQIRHYRDPAFRNRFREELKGPAQFTGNWSLMAVTEAQAPALKRYEGMTIAAYAIGAKQGLVYLRAEYTFLRAQLEAALAARRQRGLLGTAILGKQGFDFDIRIQMGAGAYVCGEETALIESLEGKRAQPRNKPPFPAVYGLYGCPTAVNNVETLSNVPLIVQHGPEWFASLGPEKNGGPKLYSISGHVKRPGVYEASMSVTLKELIFGEQYCQGMKPGRTLKAVIPGGSSVPILLPDQLDAQASFDGVVKAGSMLGSAGAIVLDDTTCMVWLATNLLHFYKHESCGKCTPCREGTDWLWVMSTFLSRHCSEPYTMGSRYLNATIPRNSELGHSKPVSTASFMSKRPPAIKESPLLMVF